MTELTYLPMRRRQKAANGAKIEKPRSQKEEKYTDILYSLFMYQTEYLMI